MPSKLERPAGPLQRAIALAFATPSRARLLENGRVRRFEHSLTTMAAGDVIAVVQALQEASIRACVTGGWGVDALLGRQTRRHADLDLIVAKHESDDAVTALRQLGYTSFVEEVTPEDCLSVRLISRDRRGRLVDLHPVDLGELMARCAELAGTELEPGWLEASGTIAGMSVTCVSVEAQVLLHQGYEPRPADRHDGELIERLAPPPSAR